MLKETSKRGVLSTNRPPSTSHCGTLGSEDTVTLSLYVHWDEVYFIGVSEFFDEIKTAAQNNDHAKDHLELGNQIFLFKPTGYKSGSGSGPMYRWKMECEGVRISIANQHIPNNEIPNVIVNVGSIFLMKNGGLLNSWDYIKEMIEIFNGKIEMVKISRIDGCVDLVDIDVSEFVKRYENNCYISRARKGSVFNQGKRKTGFKLGTGKQVRVYDKLLEVLNQPEKMLILINTRWGGKVPQCATRVEFQIGSEDLRDLGITTLQDYEKKRHSLFHYLSHEWFRMTDTEPEDNHHNRVETSSVWKIVQDAFDNWTQQEKPECLNKYIEKLPNYCHLAKQAIGCIDSIVALKDIQFEDTETLKHHLIAEFMKILEKEDLEPILEKTEYKRKKFNSLGRVFK